MPQDKPVVATIDAAPSDAPTLATAGVGTPVHLQLNQSMWLPGEKGEPSGTIELASYDIESIAESPQNPKAYPAGSGVTMSINVAGSVVHFSDLSEGYTSQHVGWSEGYKLTLKNHDPSDYTVDVWVERITDETEKILHTQARVKRGETLSLDDDMQMRFDGHNHKMVFPNQTSPLMVNLSYRQGGQELQDSTSTNLEPPKLNTWRFRNFEFQLGDYAYDDFMVLDVRRLKLRTVLVDTATTP